MLDLSLFRVVHEHEHFVYARILNFLSLRLGNLFARLYDDLPRFGIDDRLGRLAAGKAIGEVELFIVLVSAHFGDVVAAGIEEQVIKVLTDGVLRGDFAGTKTPVKFDKAVHFRARRILFQRFGDDLVAGEQILYRAVGAEAQSAQKHGDAELLFSVHADVESVLRVLFEFQPRAAVGHDGGGEHLLARLVLRRSVIHARGTDELRNDDALRAVDDEGAVFRHQGQIPHENFLVEHFVFHLVDKADLHSQRKRVGGVAVAAFFFVILGFIAESVLQKVELEVVGVVGDRGEVLEHLADAFLNERIVTVLLDFHEVGNVDDFVDGTEFSSVIFAILIDR